MKYLLTDINVKQDANFKNVMNFETEESRDKYINRILFNQGTRYDYTQNIDGIVNTFSLKADGTGTITIESNLKHSELNKKNYIILQNCETSQIKYYFITEVRKVQNNTEFSLTVREDVFATYPNVMSKIRYMSLIEGHVPLINYTNYEFNGGDSVLTDIITLEPEVAPYAIEPIPNLDRPEYTTQWLIVYRKLKSGEDGAVMKVANYNTSTLGLTYANIVEYDVTLPYKIFAAPIVSRGVGKVSGLTDINVNVEALTRRYNEEENDGLTYAFKIINYELDTKDTELVKVCRKGKYDNDTGTCSSWDSFAEVKKIDMTALFNHGFKKENENSYRLNIPKEVKSVLELLDGLNEYSLSVDQVKEFKVPLKYLVKEDEEVFIPFKKVMSFTPSDTKEAITFDWKDRWPEILDEFSWTNETEIATYVNQLNEYKANNPNSGAEFLKPLEAFANPLTYLKPAAAVSAGVGAITGTAETAIQRNSMKKAPESVKGDAATYFTMATSYSPYSFMVKKREFVGNQREAVIDVIYRNGLQLNNEYIIKDYEEIKRKRFNYVRANNPSEALEHDGTFPESVVNQFAVIFNRGVRVWQDIDKFKEFDYLFWADNGDGIFDLTDELGKKKIK